MSKLVSFDIFDTTLVRQCGEPRSIFWLLAQRLFPHDVGQRRAFYEWRKHVEKAEGGEVFTDFYLHAEERFPQFSRTRMMAEELALEGENLVANPSVRQLISRHREAGDDICFISDMYLPSETLAAFLRRAGCLMQGEAVYVSCEHHVKKETGLFYQKVRELRNPDRWTHYGDNLQSDVAQARQEGIEAHPVDTSYTPLEHRLLEAAEALPFPRDLKVLAGYHRICRLVPETDMAALMARHPFSPEALRTFRALTEAEL